MNYRYFYKNLESFVYVIIWMLIFILPFYFEYNKTCDIELVDWQIITRQWLLLLPLFLLFLFHNSIICKYLVERRYFSYSIFLFILLVIMGIVSITLAAVQEATMAGLSYLEIDYHELLNKHLIPDIIHHPINSIQSIANNLIVYILVVGFNTAIRLAGLWFSQEQQKNEVKREKLEMEIDFLKHQVSPQFFMNTLNNIYSLIDFDKDKAKGALIKFNRIMKYLLYESGNNKTTLKKEKVFLESYFDIMKIRYAKHIEIDFEAVDCHLEKVIPSLMYVNFIENAFKYGIDEEKDSFVKCKLENNNNYLIFTCSNTIHDEEEKNENLKMNHQFKGIEATRKRMEIVFKNDFELKTSAENGIFQVKLTITLH